MELTSLNVNISLYQGEPLSVFNDKTPTAYLQMVSSYISRDESYELLSEVTILASELKGRTLVFPSCSLRCLVGSF